MKTAPHRQALEKRLDRFFNYSTEYRKEVYEFVNFIKNNSDSNVYAFGGLVRDINLFTVRGFYSDVDLVIDSTREELRSILSALTNEDVSENKFGGFRVKQSQWDFDIWCAKDTWAIKQDFVKYKDIKSLLDTTFLSWDSALFDLNDRKLICKDEYLNNLREGQLDVVLQKSPNVIGSIVRLTRAIYSKGVCSIGPKAIETLHNSLNRYSTDVLIGYEKKSYSNHFLTEKNLGELSKRIRLEGKKSCSVKVLLEEQLELLERIRPNKSLCRPKEIANNLLIDSCELKRLKSKASQKRLKSVEPMVSSNSDTLKLFE